MDRAQMVIRALLGSTTTRGRRPEVLEVWDHCTLAPPPFRPPAVPGSLALGLTARDREDAIEDEQQVFILQRSSLPVPVVSAQSSEWQGGRWRYLARNRSTGPHVKGELWRAACPLHRDSQTPLVSVDSSNQKDLRNTNRSRLARPAPRFSRRLPWGARRW